MLCLAWQCHYHFTCVEFYDLGLKSLAVEKNWSILQFYPSLNHKIWWAIIFYSREFITSTSKCLLFHSCSCRTRYIKPLHVKNWCILSVSYLKNRKKNYCMNTIGWSIFGTIWLHRFVKCEDVSPNLWSKNKLLGLSYFFLKGLSSFIIKLKAVVCFCFTLHIPPCIHCSVHHQ